MLNLFTAQFVENSMEAARKAEDRIRREADKKKKRGQPPATGAKERAIEGGRARV